jgi:hypothetical protein
MGKCAAFALDVAVVEAVNGNEPELTDGTGTPQVIREPLLGTLPLT